MTINPMPPMPSMPRRSKAPRSCECGCGMLTKGGRYVPGHDARHHGWAIRLAGGHPTDGISEGERAAAIKAIEAGRWPELEMPAAE